MSERALVYGTGIAGMATLRALLARGYDAVVADDDVSADRAEQVRGLGCELLERPTEHLLNDIVAGCDFVAPSPGVPENHRVISVSRTRGVPLRSELDLAFEWESARPGGARPIVAVTGTDGKTTTVLMVEEILKTAGRKPVACGNTEVPFVAALDLDVDSFVVEATSFRLAFAESFRPCASAWLNLAPDHLDWHISMDTYEAAKARLWRNARPDDAAIGFAEDPIVMKHLNSLRCRKFTVGERTGDYRVVDGCLASPQGPFVETGQLFRDLPHDRVNALTAAAVAIEAGLADSGAVAEALRRFKGPRHRIEFVGEVAGVRYFDDSKATTPHAAITAMRGFDSIVLIAGGRNKDLDLSPLAQEAGRLRCAVLIGEAADSLKSVFQGLCPVETAGSMREAVAAAAGGARNGDVVLLSPGCTSLDWYSGYAERGDDFSRCVRELSEFESASRLGERTTQ